MFKVDTFGSAILQGLAMLYVAARPAILFLVCTIFIQDASATGASRIVLFPKNPENIDTKKDHYTVSMLAFYVTKQDPAFKRLFQSLSAVDGAASIKGDATFFDNDTSSAQQLYNLDNLAGNVGKVVPLYVNILDNVAGDAKTSVTVDVVVHKSDGAITQVMSALQDSKNGLPTNFLAAPWIGYAKVAGSLFDKLFGTNVDSYPFHATVEIKLRDAQGTFNSDGVLKEHYVLLVAPTGKNEKVNLDASKLDFDEKQQMVLYDSKPLETFSYAVLKVSKGQGFDISQLAFNSKAPWAVLVQSQFWPPQVAEGANEAQVSSAVDVVIKQLDNLAQLLKDEKRFSAFDRAKTIWGTSINAERILAEKCGATKSAKAGSKSACGVDRLDEYSKRLVSAFGFAPDQEKGIGSSAEVQRILRTQSEDFAKAARAYFQKKAGSH